MNSEQTFIKYVLTPMQDLVECLSPLMLDIDPQLICQPKIGKSISRIHRDTRFSRDKSIFRDHMWCSFVRDKKQCGGYLPEFYFSISPQGFSFGCGYYKTDTESMEAMRKMIVNRDALFMKAFRAVNSQDVFALYGDMYKRSKFPDQPEKYRQWLDRKSLCVLHDSQDFDLLFSDELGEWLREKFAALRPVYNFFIKAESHKLKGIR